MPRAPSSAVSGCLSAPRICDISRGAWSAPASYNDVISRKGLSAPATMLTSAERACQHQQATTRAATAAPMFAEWCAATSQAHPLTRAKVSASFAWPLTRMSPWILPPVLRSASTSSSVVCAHRTFVPLLSGFACASQRVTAHWQYTSHKLSFCRSVSTEVSMRQHAYVAMSMLTLPAPVSPMNAVRMLGRNAPLMSCKGTICRHEPHVCGLDWLPQV